MRPALILAVLLALLPCGSATADVVINEVLLWPGFTGAELLPYKDPWVELYNDGPGAVDLTGWTLSDRDGTVLAFLPSWTLPAGSFLTIHWDVGADDGDFTDHDGHYHLGVVSLPFDREHDECALYSSAFPSASTIVDFVAWSTGGGFVPGAAHDFAVGSGIWAAGVYFDPGYVNIANTLGRTFNGWDTNVAGDWMVYRWYDYITVGYTQPFNPVQLAPEKNIILDDATPTFDWQDAATVDAYRLEVDNDVDFSSPVIDVVVGASQHTPAARLSFGVYSWRVRGLLGGNPTAWSATWIFAVDDTGAAAAPESALGGGVACPFKWQHKDTNLLCIWDAAWSARPGCEETGAHRWDAPHPDAAPPANEPHCENYCARASIAMVNERYGGDLSQDRISYHYFREITDRVAGPEGDLGHGEWLVDQDFIDTISWALSGAAITPHFPPATGFTFTQMKDWFDTHGCFVTNLPGHVVVTNGYTDVSILGLTIKSVQIHDPARGANQRKIYEWQVGAAPQPGGIADDITAVLLQPAPPAVIVGRDQEAAVGLDTDGDGVMDFDEQNPREFHSSHTVADTDRDQVPDKNDIRDYTFHDTHHAGHDNDPLTFSDWDQDGLRSENDCDSDGKDAVDGHGDFDGGEDIDGDGHNVEAGETCMFDPEDWLLKVNVDRDVYFVGTPVRLVDQHDTRTTHTYHADSTYFYELGTGCPDKANDTPLTHSGSFTTNAGGHANSTQVQLCPSEGEHYLTVDVLSDLNYSEPDNTDPQTCWICVEFDFPIFVPGFSVSPVAAGSGPTALECSPHGVWGNAVYTADGAGGAIARIEPGDEVGPFATGLAGPRGMAFGPGPAGSFGNFLYVAENGASRISRIDPAGVTSPFTNFPGPGDLAFDPSALYGPDLFVAGTSPGPVIKIDDTGGAAFFSTLPASHLKFGPGGSWGPFLYAARHGATPGISVVAPDTTHTLLSGGFLQPAGFDWAFGPGWNGDMFAADTAAGLIYRVHSDGIRSPWASAPAPVDVAFCNCSLYVVSAEGARYRVRSDADDGDGDGHGDACDNCPGYANPGQGPVLLQPIVAANKHTFTWAGALDVVYIRGELSLVSSYAFDLQQSIPNATSFSDLAVPVSGFYYLVKADCPAGSWQSVLGAEPARDEVLP